MEKVSIFNCVSTAYEMLRFSTDSILDNAGTNEFNYIVVHWLASNEVMDYLYRMQELAKEKMGVDVYLVEHETQNIPYVPNLRAMMNDGFNKCFELSDYGGLVNTDMYFGKDWLINLMKYATPDTIVNSVHLTPPSFDHTFQYNFGIPEYSTFDLAGFNEAYARHYEDRLRTEEEVPHWTRNATMPYLIPKRFWEECGPWETMLYPLDEDGFPPDRRFFKRCHNAGAKFTMAMNSICYHHEAVERRGKRPPGAEHMAEE